MASKPLAPQRPASARPTGARPADVRQRPKSAPGKPSTLRLPVSVASSIMLEKPISKEERERLKASFERLSKPVKHQAKDVRIPTQLPK